MDKRGGAVGHRPQQVGQRCGKKTWPEQGEDVAAWGEEILFDINRANGYGSYYDPIDLQEEVINGYLVLRRSYRLGGDRDEDVYIARTNDMIIITLRTEQGEYERYIDDFNRIVSSFAPME